MTREPSGYEANKISLRPPFDQIPMIDLIVAISHTLRNRIGESIELFSEQVMAIGFVSARDITVEVSPEDRHSPLK